MKTNTGSLAKTGYAFTGWNTDAGGTGTSYLPAATFAMGKANVTLYAYWAGPGSALWAKSVASASSYSRFTGVAMDSSGNLYAVGYQYGNSAFTYGSVSATGGYASGFNAVIVKYDSTGTAQWAQAVASGSSSSQFVDVATDSSGNVYAVGYQTGSSAYTYGSLSVTGASSAGNAVIVKYDSTGTAQWAKSVASGSDASQFNDAAADSSGNVYAVGYHTGNSAYAYGNASATGAYASDANSVIVKYVQ